MNILDTQIGYVKTYNDPPGVCTVRDALKGIQKPLNNIERIAKIRKVQQQMEAEILKGNVIEAKRLKDEVKAPLKKGLPGFIFGAICEGSHTKENVIERTGIVCLDFDSDSIQDATSWKTFRDEIIKVKYVFYSALSVSGSGVMTLLKVKHPDRQAEHFEQLKADFGYLLSKQNAKGVKLDESKGQNPAQLRFLTHDPAAKYKAEFVVYDRLPPPQKKTTPHTRKHTNINAKDVFDFAYQATLSKGFTFTQGADRHESIFRFCCILNTYGIHRHEAESWIGANILPLSQIKSNCIADAYTRYQNDFAKKQFTPASRSGMTLSNIDKGKEVIKPNPHPHGFNPYTGEIFDKRGYPAAWDEVKPPEPGTAEHIEMLRAEYEAGAITEYEYAQQADPKAAKIISLFDAVPENNKSRAYME